MIADQEVRERLLGDFDRTYFVEAGAGTGKTTVVVGRIVSLVAAGRVTMEHLAAITFTEAAAAELRDRVREGLERAAADAERDAEERERCRQAAAEIDLAAVQTIHAFAGGLLRSYPLEAGLPPGFTTLDEIEQDVAFEERFRDWFWSAALEPPAHDVLRRALLLGLSQAHLRELAAALEGSHDLLAPTTTWAAPPVGDALAIAHTVGRTLRELAPWTAFAKDGADDPLAAHLARAQPGADRLLAAATEDEALAALLAVGSLKATRGNQQRWDRLPDGRNTCAALKAELGDLAAEVADVLARYRTATFTAVLALLRDFTLAGVAARKAEGVATFQDLLAWARDLLRDHADVRRRAQARYQRIFVDEFQDTDPLQAEIAFYLAAEPGQPLPADWRDVALMPGKLFVVGDPKQSIYRFRRADVAIYDALLRRLEEGRAHLVQNFRSVRAVIDWVNHHFADEMVEQEGCQPAYVALEARWDGLGAGETCGVYRVGGPLEASAAEVAAAEASALARLARAAVAEGWAVSDRDGAGERRARPARYGDVCILQPSRTHLRALERALEAVGVPYRVESGALLLATQEVRDLLAGLRAIEDPSDQVALVGALRSPAFGCSDPDLLRWVEGGGRLSHEAPGDGPDGPVRRALEVLADFHARRHALSPPALVEAYVRERLLVAAAFGEPRPREAWRRLRYVVRRAREFTASGRHTSRAFLDWIDGLARAQVRDAESAEAEPDEDAVRILTVHGAKGLEFPIVLLAGLGGERRGGSSGVEVIADRATGALAGRAGEWSTLDFAAAREREQAMARAEAIRLLYVAGTRARDHLVLSLYRSVKSDESAAARIERRLAEGELVCATLVPPPAAAPPRPAPAAAAPATAADAEAWGEAEYERTWLEGRRERIRALAAPPAVVAPGRFALRSALPLDDQLDGGETDERDLAGTVRRLLRRSRGGVLPPAPDEASAAIVQAEAILASAAYQRALASARRLHDVPLLATVDGVLLDQVADLIYEDTAGTALVTLDFGTDEHSGGDASGRERAGLAALALQAATGRAPDRIEIVRAADGQTEPLADVAALVAAARAALSPVGGC